MEKVFVPTLQNGFSVTTIVIVAILIIFYLIYVSLIKKRNNVKEAFSGMDVQFKKRYDLIPNVLFIANKFMEHERELLTNITQLRAKAAGMPNDIKQATEKIQLDNEIKSLMGQLMVSVENYPNLKSDQTMLQAMQTYNEQEEHIAAARRFYNSAVKDLNNAVEIFPSSFVAMIFGIKAMPFIEATEAERERIDASKYFTK